jgi:hypothetical protein
MSGAGFNLVGNELGSSYMNAMAPTLIFDSRHADYLVQLLNEKLSNDQLAAHMSKQFKVRITAGQVGRLLTRMRRPTDAIYRAVPYRKAGSRFGG